jgi:hypothetical protein
MLVLVNFQQDTGPTKLNGSMARNTLAGKGKGRYNEKTGRDYQYDKEYQSTPKRKKYRAALNKKNREEGTYGNKDGKDASHKKDGKLVMEHQSKNRARNGHNKKSTKK